VNIDDQVRDYYAECAKNYDSIAGYKDPVAEELRSPIKIGFQHFFEQCDVLEIACGTGYWTEVVAATANSVLAIDVNSEMIELASQRLRHTKNVNCQVADAYSLENIPGRFTAGFAHWWWSHIPVARIKTFLTGFHSKLMPGAQVLFADQLPYPAPDRRHDNEGNMRERRISPSGRCFEIIKNFPTEDKLRRYLQDIAVQVEYQEYPEQAYWTLSYRTGNKP
jgi:SAM-dependent methyltransferase